MEKKFVLCATKKNKYSNSRVVRKKISERKKKTIPPCKLNGRSLMKIICVITFGKRFRFLRM